MSLEQYPDLDLRLTEALEAAPKVRIPADFTVTLMSRVPHLKQTHRLRWESSQVATPRIALWTIRAAFAAMVLAMFLCTPWALTRSTTALAVEFALAAEFVLLAVWTSLRQTPAA